MSLVTSITVQTVAYSLTQNAHFLSTTVNGVSITSSTSSIWGKKDEAWGRKIMLLVNKSECMHNYRYRQSFSSPPLSRFSNTPGLSGFWDQSQANSALYRAFWSVEQTDFKNVIVENIHWALFEDAEVAEVKQPRNSKRREFYYKKW